MRKELEKNYDPKDIEDRLYSKWISKKYFHAEVNPDKKPYTIVIPPPNITGQLHMGHALDNTLQDILIRFKRMQGYEALWLPGTDHASIATEAKIVEAMRKRESRKRISDVKNSWSVPGTGKNSTADVSYPSLRKWDLPVIGTESVLRWTRVAIKPLRKYL